MKKLLCLTALFSLLCFPGCFTYISYGGAHYLRFGQQNVEGFVLETALSDTMTEIDVRFEQQKSEMEALKEALKTLDSLPTEVLMSLIGG